MMVERKMSLNELAARVGISNVNLSKIKNNKVTAVRFSTLAAMAKMGGSTSSMTAKTSSCAAKAISISS